MRPARASFTSGSDMDPALRTAARILPRGYGLSRGLRVPRAAMTLLGRLLAGRDVPVVAVDADVSVRLHRPARLADPTPALLWIHGGGFVMGSARQEDSFCRRLSHLTNVAVAAVDFRLPPEHPYPAPLEDCYTALLWLARQPWVVPSRIAIGGLSSGGGLAAALAFLARDRGEIQPALQLLSQPNLDDRTGSHATGRRRLVWSEGDNRQAWRWYLGGADPAVAVPARRTDLAGLAPAWIGTGSLDLLHDEAVEYGRRLNEAGTPCHVELAHGAFHAFDSIVPNAPVSLALFASQCDQLRAALTDDGSKTRDAN
ncbi:alpha/beta hydrolase [Mycolicibacterium celeriflavum]|uniref:alpha/beta hydrolase n=1 Tax=Mycolicibacterium celeriflavum TaxID=1249101 RepID=UPI003CE8A7DB